MHGMLIMVLISYSYSCHISDSWRSRWMESKHKSDYGQFVLSAGKFYGDAEKDKGEWCFIYNRDEVNDTALLEFVVSSLFYATNNTRGRGYGM